MVLKLPMAIGGYVQGLKRSGTVQFLLQELAIGRAAMRVRAYRDRVCRSCWSNFPLRNQCQRR